MNVDVFAERVLRRPLWAHQAEAALSQAFITVIAAARRTGKTSLIETLAIWTAFSNAGCRVVILSATQDAARRITEGINDTLAENPDLRGAVVDDYSTKIRLANGSQIISLPASQKQVRGYGEGVLLLILDEAGFQPNEMWTAAQYVALDEKRTAPGSSSLGRRGARARRFSARPSSPARTGIPITPPSIGPFARTPGWTMTISSASAIASRRSSSRRRSKVDGATPRARCSAPS